MNSALFTTFLFMPFFAIAQIKGDLIKEFQTLDDSLAWNLKFEDEGKGTWQEKWFLDGKKARITHSKKGMHFQAGPEQGNNSHHAVLWTKKSFEGNLKIEYEYTKTDTMERNVNILYVQATGKDTPPYHKDIAVWSELRETPKMSTYFNNMNTLHISYAAISPEGNKYVRARRYPTGPQRGFKETVVKPSYDDERSLFQTDETYAITVIKTSDRLFFKVKGKETEKVFTWNLEGWKPIAEGRVGLRHMFTRSARYANFKIYGN